jgi:hypothetical protein
MFKVTIELPESVACEQMGDNGALLFKTTVDLKAIAAAHPDVLRYAVINGFIGALNNVSRGKDDNGRPNTDAVFESLRAKRAAVWMTGQWAGKGGGGQRVSTPLREALFDERRDSFGETRAAAERHLADTVKSVLGDKEAASFDNYCLAVGTLIAKEDAGDKAPEQAAIEAAAETVRTHYATLAAEAAKRLAEAAKAVKTPKLDLAAFRKPK